MTHSTVPACTQKVKNGWNTLPRRSSAHEPQFRDEIDAAGDDWSDLDSVDEGAAGADAGAEVATAGDAEIHCKSSSIYTHRIGNYLYQAFLRKIHWIHIIHNYCNFSARFVWSKLCSTINLSFYLQFCAEAEANIAETTNADPTRTILNGRLMQLECGSSRNDRLNDALKWFSMDEPGEYPGPFYAQGGTKSVQCAIVQESMAKYKGIVRKRACAVSYLANGGNKGRYMHEISRVFPLEMRKDAVSKK